MHLEQVSKVLAYIMCHTLAMPFSRAALYIWSLLPPLVASISTGVQLRCLIPHAPQCSIIRGSSSSVKRMNSAQETP